MTPARAPAKPDGRRTLGGDGTKRRRPPTLPLGISVFSPARSYTELSALGAVIGSGRYAPLRLVRASYLDELWRTGQPMPPRALAPDSAFHDAPPDNAAVVALSCPWFNEGAPSADGPGGSHLALVGPLLRAFAAQSAGHAGWPLVRL